MKVYARYIQKDNLSYRFDTLLQFGESWDLIGNIVLANPGSAEPISKITETESSNISSFFKKIRQETINPNQWYCFSSDSTMNQIQKLFEGDYCDGIEQRELNGVIQLFNCFNLKNPNLSEAIKLLDKADPKLALNSAKIADSFGDKSVYFGFGQEVLNTPKLNSVAREIFEKTPQKLKQVFDQEFDKNKFYHLGYINRHYTSHAKNYCNKVLKPFLDDINMLP